MCIICLEFNRTKDLDGAFEMLQGAYREPGSIDKEHLIQVTLDLVEKGFRDNLKHYIFENKNADKEI